MLSKLELPSTSGLVLTVFGIYLNLRIAHSINQLINHAGDWRTAPATLGLLIRVKLKSYTLKREINLALKQ